MNRKERRAHQKKTTEISIGTEDMPANLETSDEKLEASNGKASSLSKSHDNIDFAVTVTPI